jgi:hypothetical protein
MLVFGRLDRVVVIDTVGIAVSGFGGVQARLQRLDVRCDMRDCGAAHLNEVLSLGFGDEWLQLRGGEGVDETGLGDDEQQHLGAGEDGQLVGLHADSTR